MKTKQSQSSIKERRAELIAELFLQDLNPIYLAQPTTDFGYDFFMGFQNAKGGVDTYGVEVKGTEQQVQGQFPLRASTFAKLAFSNIPAMLLAIDVKRNKLFYAWLSPDMVDAQEGRQSISIPVQAIDETTKERLRMQLASSLKSSGRVFHYQ